ncbi:hypothetical protein [Vibrio parahaemolyticus]|uniref:hypothetical protein n=1 Tax=Vibrio parahaemolyticus TaxID=670 RepID=UPI00111026FE|nr:hypothetical protein [Vibrio parahaemolyticus]TMX40881.1 hypothetical protein DA098_03355 [Vibrio parahaemolyticus]TMX79814.1 hypothetical protein DA094_04845 [Vibrio parahaemolyticus]
MADVVGSFAGGINIGRGLIDIANRKEDREIWQRDREEDRAYTKELREREKNTYELGLEDRARKIEREKRFDLEREEDRKRTKVIEGRQDTEWQQKQDLYNHQKVLLKRQEGLSQIYYPAMQRYITTGDVEVFQTPEFKSFVDENPMLAPYKAASDEVQNALTNAEGILKSAADGQEIDPYDTNLTSTVNTLFPEITQSTTLPSVYTDKEGNQHKILGRKVAGVHLMENGNISLEQELIIDDGSETGKAIRTPITENRSSDPNDPVRQISIQDLTDRMTQTRQFRDVISRGDANNLMYLSGQKSLTQDGDKFSSSSRKKDSTNATSLKKEQLSAAAKIDERFDKEIAEMSALTQDPKERDQLLREIEKRRENAHERNNVLYSQETGFDYNQSTREANEKLANRKLNIFVDSYRDYSIPSEVKVDILDMLKDGLTPSDIDQFIQANIKDGTIKKSSGNSSASIMDDIKGRSGNKHTASNNVSNEDTPSTNGAEDLPKYGGELGTALPDYQRGEGVQSYVNRQVENLHSAGRSFADWANNKQAQLQQSLVSEQ